ncbi:MAG: 4Fe-4S dicluster domain-containing protein, partial [Elusimicrobiota bacterium]
MDADALDRLLAGLRESGYRLIGPTVQDGAVVYDEIGGIADLPEGVGDEQGPGKYRLTRRKDKALFSFVVGPHSWKRFLFPPELRLLSARKVGHSWSFSPEPAPKERLAFIGVRACELAAIRIQDRVFLGGDYKDPAYEALRGSAFLIAVDCTRSGENCFCASMGAGPGSRAGFDLRLVELLEGEDPEYLVEAGSGRGESALAALALPTAGKELERRAAGAVSDCAAGMKKSLPAEGVRELLASNPEHPRWAEIASRCLSCANCTMACPTCFCSTVEETGDLRGEHAERWRRWDSCFTNDLSYLHGGSVRSSTRSKYRQWLTHKLSAWHDQFGSSGCTGCGRCVTWCPAGIDLTAEVRALGARP